MSFSPSSHRPSPPGTGLQFSLRTLFIWVAALCGLFAVLAQLPLVWGLFCLWFLVLVAGHVIGNALGTRLRDRGTLGDADATPPDPPPGEHPSRRAPSSPTRLQEKTPLGRTMFAIAAFGAVAGGYLGGSAAVLATGDDITMSGIVVATGSSAVIGGLFGWLAASFLTVIFTTVLQGARAK